MKTRLRIDDTVMVRAREEAARRGCTISELAEAALRLLLERNESPPEVPDLPRFRSGGATTDVSDRDALYRVMEGG